MLARNRCRLCGRIVIQNRSSHLRRYHKIDSRYKGAVKDYFIEA